MLNGILSVVILLYFNVKVPPVAPYKDKLYWALTFYGLIVSYLLSNILNLSSNLRGVKTLIE